MLTDHEIKIRHEERWKLLVNQYGTKFSVPANEVSRVSELLRADYVTQLHARSGSNSSLAQAFREYGIVPSIAVEITGEEPEIERRQKRADKYKTVFDWCMANPGKVTSVKEVAAVGGFSTSTANSLIRDHVDLFKKAKRGEYIIRNRDAERAEEK